MKIHIPEIGEEIKLSKPWEFALYFEQRNKGLIKALKLNQHFSLGPNEGFPEERRVKAEKDLQENCILPFNFPTIYKGIQKTFLGPNPLRRRYYPWVFVIENIIFPENVRLKTDRIYIRKGSEDFSSVSFLVNKEDNHLIGAEPKRQIRFWAKLGDVNNIEFNET